MQTRNTDGTTVRVRIAVAVSEAGTTRTHVVDDHWIQSKESFQKFINEIRQDKQLWTVRVVTTDVPYPVSSHSQILPNEDLS